KENEQLKPVLEGIEMTVKSFNDAVAKFGVEIVNPQGEQFNPEFHQAKCHSIFCDDVQRTDTYLTGAALASKTGQKKCL
ncbi:MAG: nucleotide exchange factor GrpE, partial [Pseudomonadota bacterium]